MQAPDVFATPDASQAKHDRRMTSLDGLRGLAALSIFVFHGWLYTMPAPVAANRSTVADFAAHELRLGVVVFFVLSGFLLSRPWLAAALDGRRPPDLRRYVLSRGARIAPAYYLALIGSIVLLWGLAGTPGLRLPPAHELPLFFVFAQNLSPASVMKLNPPMWSLAVEVSFYALLPVLGWLATRLPARRSAQALIPLALIAAGTVYNWSIAGHGLGMTFSKTLPAMVPYFALGMLAAVALHGRTVPAARRRGLIAAGVVLVLADAFVKSAAPAGLFGPTAVEPAQYFPILRDLVAAVGFTLLVAALASAPRSPVLGSAPLRGLGTISYGLYLWHVPVLLALRGHGLLPLHPLLGMAVAIGPAVALSALSWFALERPILRAARRRMRRAPAKRPEPASGRGDVDRRPGRPEVGAARA